MKKKSYPPHTENVDVLAAFFDRVDTERLKDIEPLENVPEREMVGLAISLPRDDFEKLEQLAAREGLSADRFIGRVLRRVLRSLPSVIGGPAGRPATKETRTSQGFTAMQGQYLAFINSYTKLHGIAPAEADLQRYFRVSPPSVHQMILNLEKRHLIERVPGQARSIRILLLESEIPDLP